MKKQQAGFTLIELVVVIVILGILAAAAVPRFANLTTQAEQASADGILGAFMSQAVISLGENSGTAQPFATILAAMDLTGDAVGSIGGSCGAVVVTIGASTANAALSTNLCSG